jgi:hypothetical protein
MHSSNFAVGSGVQSAHNPHLRIRGPFGVGNHEMISSHRKLLWPKAMVMSVAVTSERMLRLAGLGEASESAAEASKS